MPILRPRVVGGDILVSDGRISAAAGTDEDGVISAITKWIPVEVIAFYQGITIPFGDSLAHGLWFAIPFGTVVTGLWIAFATKSTSPDIWKALLSWWHPGINPATLAAGAVALPIADGVMRRLGLPQD